MTDYDLQQKLIEQRRQQYGQQAQFQAPQGQMVGGHFIAPNALQYLASGLRSIGGMRGEELAGQQLQDLQKQRTEGTQKALANFLRQAQGTPENVPGDGMGPVRPEQKRDMGAAFAALMEAPDKAYQQAGMQGILQIPEIEARSADRAADRQAKEQEAEARRAQRMEEIRIQHENRMEYLRQMNADRAQLAEENRRFRAQQADESRALRSTIASSAKEKPPAGYRFKEDGTLEAIPGGPAASKTGEKPLTEGQAKGTLYLGQMRSASDELDKLPATSPAAVAAAGSTYTNWAAPAGAQKVAQLQNQWAEAFLRAKTGAAATESEVALNRRTFFPVVGDSDAVIKQKARMRKQAEKDMESVAGPGAQRASSPTKPAASGGFRIVE